MSKELIERLRADAESTDDIGLCADAAERIEELERDLLNLVCRIHRDGGHYIAKYGEAKAIADADTVAAQNNADLDALQADNARLRAAFETLWLGTNPNEWDASYIAAANPSAILELIAAYLEAVAALSDPALYCSDTTYCDEFCCREKQRNALATAKRLGVE